MKSSFRILTSILVLIGITATQSCGVYSLSGASTTAETITVEEFLNNTDLAPANIAQNFTNRLKDYYQQNSSLRVVPEEGQLQIEGVITDYRLNPLAPVSTGTDRTTQADLTRLTIAVRVNYVDTTEPKNSFKDRSFSFYADFPNTQDLIQVQESLERKIFDQILIDIFNATIANW